MKRINLQLGEKDNPQRVKRLKRIIKKFIPIFLVVAIFISLAIFIITLSSGPSVFNYIFTGSSLNSYDGRANVLLLGIAGGTHAGASLTDTIIVASYNLKTNQVHLISIPRDLWLPSLQSKANAVYEIGLEESDGLRFAKTIMGNIVGLPIHYSLRVDFRGFIKAVDILGGIDVLVENAFDDYNYPIEGKENDMCGNSEEEREFNEEEAKHLNIEPGKRKVLILTDGKIATDSAEEDKGLRYFSCRYEHISFNKGLTSMDGATALKFVRSRRGTNGEASDFARSKRQQKILEAIRGKALSLDFWDPQKISDLIKTFGQSLDTDISIKDALEFYRLFGKLKNSKSIVLDDSKKSGLADGRTSLLVAPNPQDFGGAYVLVSQDDDFSIIHSYVRKILSGEIKEDEATSSAWSSN